MSVTVEQIKKLQDSRSLRKELNIPIRWRVLTTKGGICRITAYQDARDVQKVLYYVCGPNNWENEPSNLNGKMYMSIRIRTDEGWVSKSDVGEETSIAAAKGESSDALKRAASAWGIFRDLYDYDYIVLKCAADGKTPLTEDGKRLETPWALSLYCNGISSSMGLLIKLYKQIGVSMEDSELLNAFSLIKERIKK